MSVFGYMVGSWSNPKMVPKPSKPMKAGMPEIPDDFGELSHEEQMEVLDDIFNTIAFNNQLTRKHRGEQKACREAVFDAMQNQAMEAKMQARSYAKAKAADKKLLSKLTQRTLQRNKASEKQDIIKIAKTMKSKNRKARKTQAKVKREGTKGV